MRLPIAKLACAAVLALPAAAMADTYVFVTNSTPEPVQIEVAHSSSNNLLK